MNKVELALSSKTTSRDVSSLLGSIVPSFGNVFNERLSYKNEESDKKSALKQNKWIFEAKWGLHPIIKILTNGEFLTLNFLTWNTRLISSRLSFTLWGEGAFLALVGRPFSDGVATNILYEVDVLLHRPALSPIFSYWNGQNWVWFYR